MRNITTAVTVLASLIALAGVSQAQPIVTVTQGTTTSGADLFVFNVDPNGVTYDTIDLTLTSTTGFANTETNPATTLFAAAGTVDDTDVLGLNTVAMGWSILGTFDDANKLALAGGPLGSDITAPVDFAQAVFPSGTNGSGDWTFNFADNGNLVDSQSGTFAVGSTGGVAPTALFSGAPYTVGTVGGSDFSATLDASPSTGDGPLSFEWDLGSGFVAGPADGKLPIADAFAEFGAFGVAFPVSVRVTNSLGSDTAGTTITVIPEPASLLLASIGLIGIVAGRRRRAA